MTSQILCREPTPPVDDNFGYPTPPCDLQEFVGRTPSRGSTASLGDTTACEAGAPITGTNTPPPQQIPLNRLKYWYATLMPTSGLPTQPSSGPDLDPNWDVLLRDLEAIASTGTAIDEMIDYYSEDESYIAHNPNGDPNTLAVLPFDNRPSEGCFQTGLRIHLWENTELEMEYQTLGVVGTNETGQERIPSDTQKEEEDMAPDLAGDSGEIREVTPSPKENLHQPLKILVH